MTTLTLQISNLNELPDGGPLTFTAHGRSFEIGRDLFRDWVLPDPDLFISGRHAEIQFDGQNYYLNDVSRNGTFVNGATQRVKSPYRIFNGDRIEIGNYIIVAHLQGEAAPRDFNSNKDQAFGGDDDDIWGVGAAAAPPPGNRRDFMPRQNVSYAEPDFAHSYVDMPALNPQTSFPTSPQPGFPPAQQGFPAQPQGFSPQPQGFPPQPAGGLQHPANPFAAETGFNRPTPGAASWQPPVQQGQSAPQDMRGVMPSTHGAGGFMEAFIRATQLSPATVQSRNAAELGEELGEMMLVAVELMMTLLNARASAKSLVRSADRTMIGPMDNNPLKFVPGAAAALDTMMGQGRGGYLDGKRAFREAFDDLKNHEMATYAAMQKALFRLLEDDLSPEAIEKKLPKSAFSSNKAKAWDAYVSRWNGKTEGRDNGMLDVFLTYFGEAYREAAGKKR